MSRTRIHKRLTSALWLALPLLFCSCRATRPPAGDACLPPLPSPAVCALPTVPVPYDVTCRNPWKPSGTSCPWPAEEYVCDGGDRAPGVTIDQQWNVEGLDPTDTVAQYEALNGQTLVEPSNRVCLYAPRFGAVRSVARLIESEQILVTRGADVPLRLARADDLGIPVDHSQRIKATGQKNNFLPESYDMRQLASQAMLRLPALGLQDIQLPGAGNHLMATGRYENKDLAIIGEATAAAEYWSDIDAPQIELNHQGAEFLIEENKPQIIYTVKDLRNSPKLRLCKVASTQSAQPGDEVHFALRYDNVGDQPIGNIVILDRLSSRLQYLEGSAQSSQPAEFASSQGDGNTLVLRWEIDNSLKPGDGGVVTFRCKVR